MIQHKEHTMLSSVYIARIVERTVFPRDLFTIVTKY